MKDSLNKLDPMPLAFTPALPRAMQVATHGKRRASAPVAAPYDPYGSDPAFRTYAAGAPQSVYSVNVSSQGRISRFGITYGLNIDSVLPEELRQFSSPQVEPKVAKQAAEKQMGRHAELAEASYEAAQQALYALLALTSKQYVRDFLRHEFGAARLLHVACQDLDKLISMCDSLINIHKMVVRRPSESASLGYPFNAFARLDSLRVETPSVGYACGGVLKPTTGSF